MSFQIKTTSFEGPLDLLLDLIEKRKLFIGDISLAQVADDYIAHIRSLGSFPVRDTAHFLLVASTLVLIKSKSLLPDLSLSEEEQSDIASLERRLKILARIREASHVIHGSFGKNVLFGKLQNKTVNPVFAPDRETTKMGIREAIGRIVAHLPQKEIIPEAIVRKVMSLEEMMTRLSERIKRSLKMSFREFAGRAPRAELIVSFLALLELVREGAMDVAQEDRFGEIAMESRDMAVPKYN